MEKEKSDEISYILATPYTIAKSRTGGVISRLLSRLDLELVGSQIFAPSKELAEAYAASLEQNTPPHHEDVNLPSAGRLLADYVRQNFVPSGGRRHRVLMMLFRGTDACKKLSDVAGALYQENRGPESLTGETIRDTYADLILDRENPHNVRYFEPAVMTPRNQETALKHMKVFADFIDSEPNLIDNMTYPEPEKIERTLVIIKPDNWQFASSRPGTIIDMFSRTGLRIIGCKVQRMSVAQALEFYGPVKNVLRDKLSPVFGKKATATLEREFGISIGEELRREITNTFGVYYAEDQFGQIVEFMSGIRPEDCPVDEQHNPGKVKSMVLIYEGIDAVKKIRDVLGPTDPTKAPGGTVRREFGSNVMVNTAHASDSPENAKREMKILKIEENNCGRVLKDYIARVEG
ncbi:nucleoside-diphosphate kinase [Sediminispirochaeta smaragdinae]|uniref:Nucleoside diphosphate kinase n=1 Tax=Sediminispirochaeta smaragdinae (strain DSM 11293 / JCM 15392 / SEBR 4228) TaxID=573413 RepID=E1R8V2_SEDSS|nr:nucleoside-diphosphate kinase [Sediminispirochaeta smaragdinae]ADK81859.1 nucleoside diphosphate kinase [Sediminispirochaeta smaragdinae DSM 11293]